MSRRESRLHGVVVIDKPAGLTSHDVVQRMRRIAGTSRVGHAGTLDPMATGVLVVMIGEATKLGPYLTADRKRYRARVQLGRATDTLDAEGGTVAEAALPPWWVDERDARIDAALACEAARTEQVPPVYSAISVDGERSHERARRGEATELAPRPVRVAALRREATATDGAIDLELEVSKGYYVRSLARDLGDALGCPAHLSALRRLSSGRFTEDRALGLDAVMQEPLLLDVSLLDVASAATLVLPTARLTTEGAVRARQGKPLTAADFAEPPGAEGSSAWLDPCGKLVATGAKESDRYRISRGFIDYA